MPDATCQTCYMKMWIVFARKLVQQEEFRRNETANQYNIQKDVFSQRYPSVVVTVDFSHPILSGLSNGDFWCGASVDEDAYANPYNAANYPWEVELKVWNRFQKKCKMMTPEEIETLREKRDNEIKDLEREWDERPVFAKRFRPDY